jgi:rhamnose transport system permease protein
MSAIARHRRELSVAAAYGLVLLGLAVFAPRFFRPENLRIEAVKNAPVLVAAVGMTLVILTRQIDISIGAQVSVGAVVAGLLSRSGLPVAMACAATVLIGAVMGAVNGLFVAVAGLPSIVVTLATLFIARESLRYVREGASVASGFQWFGLGQEAGSWAAVGIALAVFAAAGLALRYLAVGRALYATGSEPEAARLAGIRPRRVVFGAFVAMGALAGLASLLNAAPLAIFDTNTGGAGFEMKVIAAVVVGGTAISGGRGTLVGTFFGVALLGTVAPALVYYHIRPEWEQAIQGAIILLAVATDALDRGER